MADGRAAAGTALAAALGSLLCCALPSLSVLLGMGTTVAAVVSAAPGLVSLSRHKTWVFLAAGLLVAGSRLYLSYGVPRLTAEGASCPGSVGRWTRGIWWASAVLYGVGGFVAFVLGPILDRIQP